MFCYVRVSLWWELFRDFQYNKVDQQGRREGRDVEAAAWGCPSVSGCAVRLCGAYVRRGGACAW